MFRGGTTPICPQEDFSHTSISDKEGFPHTPTSTSTNGILQICQQAKFVWGGQHPHTPLKLSPWVHTEDKMLIILLKQEPSFRKTLDLLKKVLSLTLPSKNNSIREIADGTEHTLTRALEIISLISAHLNYTEKS